MSALLLWFQIFSLDSCSTVWNPIAMSFTYKSESLNFYVDKLVIENECTYVTRDSSGAFTIEIPSDYGIIKFKP